MKITIIYRFCLLLPIFFTSCTSLKRQEESIKSHSIVNSQDMSLFEKAFHDLGMGNYDSVIPVFQKLSEKYRGQDLEWAALYNLASAYKELNQCEKAEKIYQRLLPKTQKHVHLKPRVYLSLAYVYECLGQMEQNLIALKEGIKYTHHLTPDIRLIEYPARLALAYIRMNEDKIGLQMQKVVYKNLENTKKIFRISSAADENFSRYFYTIGRSHVSTNHVHLNIFLKIFPYYQTYLTQSILLKTGKWSVKAEKELGDLYRKLWANLKKQKSKKKYYAPVKKIITQLKDIAQESKNKKMQAVYLGLRKKTQSYLDQK